MKYTCNMETVQQNGRFTIFSSKFPSNIYSILVAWESLSLFTFLPLHLFVNKAVGLLHRLDLHRLLKGYKYYYGIG